MVGKKTSNDLNGLAKQGVISLVTLEAWTLWNHRNWCVLEGSTPNVVRVLASAGEEELPHFLYFSPFSKRILHLDPFGKELRFWTLGVGAMICGAEITCLVMRT